MKVKDETWYEIEKLENGEYYTVQNKHRECAQVWRINNVYILFQCPTCGFEPFFDSTHILNAIGLYNLIKIIESW